MVRLSPGQLAGYRLLLSLHLHRRDEKKAIEVCGQLMECDPKYVAAWRIRAGLREKMDDLKGAIADYSHHLAIAPDQDEIYLERASVHVLRDDYRSAIDDYTAYLRLNPAHEMTYRLRAKAHEAVGSLAQAIDDYGRCLQLEPDSIEVHLRRGAIYQQLDQFDKAAADFREVLQRRSRHHVAERGLSQAIELEHWRKQTIEELSAPIFAEPNDPDRYRRRGVAHRMRGDFIASLADLTTALELGGENARNWCERAETYASCELYVEGLADVEYALTLAPANAEAIGLKGWILTQTPDGHLHDVPQGLALLRQARELSAGKSPEVLERLAQVEELSGNLDRAIATQEELLRLIEEIDVEESVIAEYRAGLVRYQLKRIALLTPFLR